MEKQKNFENYWELKKKFKTDPVKKFENKKKFTPPGIKPRTLGVRFCVPSFAVHRGHNTSCPTAVGKTFLLNREKFSV